VRRLGIAAEEVLDLDHIEDNPYYRTAAAAHRERIQ